MLFVISTAFETIDQVKVAISKQKASASLHDVMEFNASKDIAEKLFFEYCYSIEKQVIGYGRCGTVVKLNFNHQVVALKLADLYKCSKEIVNEMKNEANIYNFLKKNSFIHCPDMIYSGVLGPFFSICSTFVDGYAHSSFDDMTKQSKKTCLLILKMLHNLRVLHGDLRPENFIISKYNSETKTGKVIILDFGFSSILDCSDASTEMLDNEYKNFENLLI